MPEPQFTPEPWEYRLESLRGGNYHVIVVPGWEESIDLHEDEPNAKETAHLIAAAPDLYTAGTKALRQLQAVVNILDPAGESAAMVAAAELEAALAKARGEGDG